MTDVIDIFEEIIKIIEATLGFEEQLKTSGFFDDFEEKVLVPSKELHEELIKILHHHVTQGEQKLMEIEKMANLKKVKSMIKNKMNIKGESDAQQV